MTYSEPVRWREFKVALNYAPNNCRGRLGKLPKTCYLTPNLLIILGNFVKHCSKCGIEHDRNGQSYCLACHAECMRRTRPKYAQLTPVQRMKNISRAYANVYYRRGKLIAQDCAACASEVVQKHHPDYEKPIDVEWLCVRCHLAHHKYANDPALNARIRAITEILRTAT